MASKKSEVPTSVYNVFCDTFNTKVEAKIHQADDKDKLLLEVSNEEGEKLSISLYHEDVVMLSAFLDSLSDYTDTRK